jgi:hypothetical protein
VQKRLGRGYKVLQWGGKVLQPRIGLEVDAHQASASASADGMLRKKPNNPPGVAQAGTGAGTGLS